jgi:hypothetical protein
MTKSTLVLNAMIILFIAGCTKNDLQPKAPMPASSQGLAQAKALFSSDADFTTTVTDSGTTIVNYRPNPENGCDVYSDFYYNNEGVNQNYVPELPVNAWNYLGYILTRSFIKFPKLYKFPDTTTIISAKLYLYPPKDFLDHPQGNTGANECVIQRITSKNWTEDTLRWATQPRGVATDDEAFIPATTDQYGYAPVIDITAAVAKMISRQAHNYGFRITLVNEVPDAAVNFASSEAVDAWRRPMLQIEYK